MKNKKGQDVNMLFVVVIMLVIAIAIVAGYKVIKQFNSTFQTLGNVPADIKADMQNVQDKYVTRFDVLFLFLFVLVYLGLIGSAFFIDTHPIFFIIAILVAIVTGIVGGSLANSYAQFSDTMTESSQFKIIPYIFQHYVAIIIIMGFSVAIALYAKLRSSSG